MDSPDTSPQINKKALPHMAIFLASNRQNNKKTNKKIKLPRIFKSLN
jgi:hypothetical protein